MNNPNVQMGAKRKTIIKVIHEAVDGWLASLPPELCKEVAPDVIVTGGSIASLLLGECIKDFDVYLRTNRSAELLARHYCDIFNGLHPGRTHRPYVRYYDPESSEEIYEPGPDDYQGVVGIFVSSSGIAGDPDRLPVPIEEGFLSPVEETPPEDARYTPVFLSQNAITLSDKIQIVLRFTGEVQEIHSNYDYVHATCSYEYAQRRLTLPGAALESMLARELVYTGSLYPLCSLFRMRKFLDRGWRISAGEIVKMAVQISQLDLLDINVLRQQLIGVDAAYFFHLIARLRTFADSNPGTPLDSGYIIGIIDELADRGHI
jgi:hypothetical protein